MTATGDAKMGVDSHHHFWTLSRGDYGWLTPAVEPLYRDFGPGDLEPHLRAVGVRRTVIVQAAPTVAETRHLLAIASREAAVAGVVGWVDMDRPEAALRDLARLAREGALIGIRPMIQDIGYTTWMLQPSPARVFERMIEVDLAFDALVRPAHLPVLRELLARYPEMRTVIDHGGKPDIAARRWQPWADRMSALAGETGAFCKLSGLVTEARLDDGAGALVPYMDHLYRCFGPERLMWGSDWPVLNLGGRATGAGAAAHAPGEKETATPAYCRWHAAVQDWLGDRGAVAAGAILGGTATRFYGLNTPHTREATHDERI